MAKKVALVLAGSGVYDGSEIHEAVVCILNLQRLGAEISFFAPDIEQADCINHLTGEPEPAPRGVLAESARIARGKIAPLSEFDAEKFDAIVFPGGFGAAKNLCTFAFDGADCTVNADVDAAIKSMLKLGKPQAFLCIAPVVAAKAIGGGVELTIGNDPSTAAAIEKMGAVHIRCQPDAFVEDEKLRVFSTPAYMLAESVAEIDRGVAAMFKKMLA